LHSICFFSCMIAQQQQHVVVHTGWQGSFSCKTRHQEQPPPENGTSARSAATFYIFSVFYGNQPPQLRVNAQVVTRPCQASARPCKETREPPSQCVFSLELHAQVGICARLAKECVQAGAWTQSTDVEEAGAPLTTVSLLGIHDFSSNMDVLAI
jgi:hypothetical protein